MHWTVVLRSTHQKTGGGGVDVHRPDVLDGRKKARGSEVLRTNEDEGTNWGGEDREGNSPTKRWIAPTPGEGKAKLRTRSTPFHNSGPCKGGPFTIGAWEQTYGG